MRSRSNDIFGLTSEHICMLYGTHKRRLGVGGIRRFRHHHSSEWEECADEKIDRNARDSLMLILDAFSMAFI